jgi:hypothetical protein
MYELGIDVVWFPKADISKKYAIVTYEGSAPRGKRQ